MKKYSVDILLLALGSLLFAIAVNVFVIPNDLGEGGVTGLTIISYYLFEWSPSIVSFLLNAVLIVLGLKFLSKQTAIYTIIAVCFNSLFLHVTESWSIPSEEIIVHALFGGVLTGIGIGLIIRVGGTTAGSTILAKIIHKYLGWSVSYSLLILDLIVVFLSYFIIGIEGVMLTIVMLYVATKTMEFILEGANRQKAVTIISAYSKEIAFEVSTRMERGITVISGHGYYTKENKEVLYIVINNQEIIKLKKIIKQIDNEAFITIHDVRDVFGEGFSAI
ncbi:YitT family protein [Niallia taxi]|uniref:YitT family protein n=1 Tax=Niallia taxi TaxID=2499688 RepID=A0A3S2U959_9BACI|nr:YitT family protein [Niallia taxi]MDK8641984.1 YitT family protein [Niallia taxi]MED4036441.1 YitT family protein [Niallia taxi]MED4054494.1 YitT family protein [Niallia taxi]MED4122087.1 YitT family protein [Niallia taxi]RVT60818.1 YitT family protein [Niallia taxi]